MSTAKLPPEVAAKGKKGAGRYGLGRGLYLHVRPNGLRSWAVRYRDRITGKLRETGLGSFPQVTLAEARAQADELRSAIRKGANPIDNAHAERAAARLERAREKTFGDCATAYIAAHQASWRNAKHRQQWRNTLDTYAAKLLPLPVQAIDTDLVVGVLEPIWIDKTETATRVRQRIEAVLDWASVRKFRAGENPARWRGHMDKLLAKPAKVKRVTHHPALPYADLPAFMEKLTERDTLARAALRFQILTATRPNEATGARWSEIDLPGKVWTIPAERMKANREHRVPLSAEAVKLLSALAGERSGAVFPGNKTNRTLTIAATYGVVKELRPDLTAHGFRSSFRVWCAERTAYAREVAEAALAHAIKDQTEAAYNRTDLLALRARLMADWGRYCCTPTKASGKVTPLRRRASGASGYMANSHDDSA